VLGPILFCLFINDLPLYISDKSVVCHLLADDTTIEAQGNLPDVQSSLQTALIDIDQWCSNNRMVLNPQKNKIYDSFHPPKTPVITNPFRSQYWQL
jgi:hypothetical protein